VSRPVGGGIGFWRRGVGWGEEGGRRKRGERGATRIKLYCGVATISRMPKNMFLCRI